MKKTDSYVMRLNYNQQKSNLVKIVFNLKYKVISQCAVSSKNVGDHGPPQHPVHLHI